MNASIKRSYLLNHFEIYKLTKNMRLSCISNDKKQQQEIKDFADWILNIGDGITTSDEGDEWIQIPSDLMLDKEDEPKETIVKSTYPYLFTNYLDPKYLEERAILCPRNETIEEINEYIMSQIEGEEVMYHSSDNVCKASTSSSMKPNNISH